MQKCYADGKLRIVARPLLDEQKLAAGRTDMAPTVRPFTLTAA
jgi:hypothetical protein